MEVTHDKKNASKTDVLSVLIADDDTPTRVLLCAAIAQWGYEVVEVKDGEQAWEVMQRPGAPRLLIVDWLMPKLNGIDLCERVKKEGQQNCYIILLTQQAVMNNLVKGLEAGADEFLEKPFNMVELKCRLTIGARVMRVEAALANKHEKLKNHISQIESSAIVSLETIQQIIDSLSTGSLDKNDGVVSVVTSMNELITNLETIINVIKEYRHDSSRGS